MIYIISDGVVVAEPCHCGDKIRISPTSRLSRIITHNINIIVITTTVTICLYHESHYLRQKLLWREAERVGLARFTGGRVIRVFI